MIPRTLFAKLALALVLLLISIGLLYTMLSTTLAQHYQQVFLQQLNEGLAQNLIADRQLVKDGVLNQTALEETFHHYMMVNPSIEIYLVDLQGKLLSYSAEPGKVKRNYIDLNPIRNFLADQAFPLLGDDPRSHDRRKVFSVAPVPSATAPQGYLYVVLRGEEYDRIEQLFQNSFLARLSGTAVAVSLAVGLVVGLFLFHLFTRRLRHLGRQMRQFGASDFNQLTPYTEAKDSQDEIASLGHHYNRMAERICTLIADLKRQDEVRRELVANVSHDLRTPLASLQGYIESLKLKAADLDASTQAQYLDIALQHSRRLTKLVEELFELAKLDAHETQLHRERFAPAELVQDVIQKFQLTAAAHELRLRMDCSEPLPFVEADIGLIERVLENVLSNSLRHTPNGGEISVALQRRDPAVEIQIRDTGTGIPAEDLPHIFERFYRGTDKERSNAHAGLGLAIAQRIVALHGGNIEVTSAPGIGTVFSFSLPAWHPDSGRVTALV
jgi:signal transduction histidine kinase